MITILSEPDYTPIANDNQLCFSIFSGMSFQIVNIFALGLSHGVSEPLPAPPKLDVVDVSVFCNE